MKVFVREAVGSMSLKLGTDIERYSAEIGYWLGAAPLGPRGHERGRARGLAFTELAFLRVFAVPFTRNRASVRVLERAGQWGHFSIVCRLWSGV